MPKPGHATTPAGDLRAALGSAAKVAERNTTIPILASVLVEASGGEMRVTGTDMERRITTTIAADGTLPPVPISAARLAGLLAKSPAGQPVKIASDDRGVRVTTGGLSAQIATLEAEDFPSFGRRTGTAWEVEARILRQLMTRPSHAVSTEESRYYLNGIFLHIRQAGGNQVLAACATDGHRLLLASAPEGAGVPPLASGIIVPRSSCGVIADLLAAEPAGGVVSMTCNETQIALSSKGWQFASKLVDGTFPEYDRVIPRGGPHILHVRSPAVMADHIATVSSISDDRSRGVKIEEGGAPDVSLAATSDAGEARLALSEDIATWESAGPHPGFTCQARYLIDICKTFQNGFRAHITDSLAPIRCEGDEALAVLMPFRA